jgi:ribosomal protein S18 acetylase RimI-like enzyme
MKKNPKIETRIRDYRPEDYEPVFELWELCDLAQPERGDSPEVIRRCNEHGGRLLVLEEKGTGKMIGSSWMTWDGRRIYLHHFGIHPHYRGRGLGMELAEKSLEWIKEKGQQVKLEVHKDNREAIKMYEKLGFFAFRDYDVYMIRDFEK